MVFQDPAFEEVDKRILIALGARIVETPEAKDLINESTFLFSLHTEPDVFETYCIQRRPAAFVGNTAEFMLDVSISDLDSSSTRDEGQPADILVAKALTGRAYATFLKEYTSEALPEVEFTGLVDQHIDGHVDHFFYATRFYRRRKAAEVEEEKCHGCQKSAAMLGSSLKTCARCDKMRYCSKICQ